MTRPGGAPRRCRCARWPRTRSSLAVRHDGDPHPRGAGAPGVAGGGRSLVEDDVGFTDLARPAAAGAAPRAPTKRRSRRRLMAGPRTGIRRSQASSRPPGGLSIASVPSTAGHAVGETAQAAARRRGRRRRGRRRDDDLDEQPRLCAPDRRRTRSPPRRVLGDVRQRLGDEEVRRRLDRRGEPVARPRRRARPGPFARVGQRVDRRRRAPRSVRTAGWMPRASSRSSARAVASRCSAMLSTDRLQGPSSARLEQRAAPAPARRAAAARRRAGRARSGGARRRPASTMRSRETRSSSTRARSSAFRRSLSIASAAPAAAAWTSSGLASSAASWTIAATRRPSRSTAVHVRPESGLGQLHAPPGLVDEALAIRQPVGDVHRPVAEASRPGSRAPARCRPGAGRERWRGRRFAERRATRRAPRVRLRRQVLRARAAADRREGRGRSARRSPACRDRRRPALRAPRARRRRRREVPRRPRPPALPRRRWQAARARATALGRSTAPSRRLGCEPTGPDRGPAVGAS